ncbi:hypothetical protein RQP54_19605 [Curvibacter sp. APW13]|uniref:hypothetical protein n=1 Tax=Curvibacter sp. APW13 TaxID=3077236 RepID=UPI0028DDD75D|nr:hypothetical protein [Curvibacter sp. APW13]MDT8993089.1 hypothetical protein [Curvibacter sp. APW13]
MRHFCTLFDSNYLLKGVAMLRTLKQHCPDAYVHVLCMDGQTREILEQLGLAHVTCLSLPEVEDQALLAVKPDRSVAEYCWTLSPCLPWYVLQHNPEIDAITYLDADLLFYSPLQPLFDEIGDASIVIIEHRFPPALKHLEVNGRFCVEWVGFRRDAHGMACLARWREQCIEWCFHRLEGDRMGDQKYLDQWPASFDGVHVIQHVGAGLAPWNYAQYSFAEDNHKKIFVDGEPLIFYHFHQFQLLSDGSFDRLSAAYRAMGREPETVYRAYEQSLIGILSEVRSIRPGFSGGVKPFLRIKSQRLVQWLVPQEVKQWLKKFIKAV